MKYFLDTEFIEDGKTIDLLSIAIVAEDGRELYAESDEANISLASDWVRENVLPHLWHCQADKRQFNAWTRDGGVGGLLHRHEIAREIRGFCNPLQHGEPQFWGYYADYDWVALCQLFGPMIDLPKGWPMYCNDVKQLCVSLGDPSLPAQTAKEHHALYDARWTKQAWEFLVRGYGFSARQQR